MNITPMHLGSLHPIEQALTLLLAFGPFVVLGIVIAVRRRHDRAAELLQEQEQHPQPDADQALDPQRER